MASIAPKLFLSLFFLLALPLPLQGGKRLEKATFAGGCFWCMIKPFADLPGVVSVLSGYSGGKTETPDYQEVAGGESGHLEVIQIEYDPDQVSYTELLDIFWRQIDPTDSGGQFVDRGSQYGTAIFYHNEEQRRLAQASLKAMAESGRYRAPIATPIMAAQPFYRAEEDHQNFYKKNPRRYQQYRAGSGRDAFLNKVWGHGHDDNDRALRQRLTAMQYKVVRENGTEPPFANPYWDNKEEGIYVDIVSGEPLFSSRDKYDSGTGWPSFTKPLHAAAIKEVEDRGLWSVRTEVRSSRADSHLGHVFEDGPLPGGRRYCINSAALRFISTQKMAVEGYGDYLPLFSH